MPTIFVALATFARPLRVPGLPAQQRQRPGARRQRPRGERTRRRPRSLGRWSTGRSSRRRSSTTRPPRAARPFPAPRARPARRGPDHLFGARPRGRDPGPRAGPGSGARHLELMSGADVTFRAMGSEIRLIVGEPGPNGIDPIDAVAETRAFVEEFEQCLSRFRPDSELCALNAYVGDVVPASPLLRDAVAAGIAAAERTGGLVDPTLVDEIEGAGYVGSREGAASADLTTALLMAPERKPARPDPTRRWAMIEVDEEVGVIRRPPRRPLRQRRHRQGPRRRPDRRAARRPDALRDRLRRRPPRRRHAARAPGGAGRASDHRRPGPPPLHRERRRRHLRDQRPGLAPRGRPLRPPSDRPADRRAGLDRPGRRDRAGPDRRRGRDDGQGGAAVRPGRRARACSASTAASSSTRTARPSRSGRSS